MKKIKILVDKIVTFKNLQKALSGPITFQTLEALGLPYQTQMFGDDYAKTLWAFDEKRGFFVPQSAKAVIVDPVALSQVLATDRVYDMYLTSEGGHEEANLAMHGTTHPEGGEKLTEEAMDRWKKFYDQYFEEITK